MPNATLLRRVAAAAASLAVTACATGHAYHDPIVTDRPDYTESPLPVPTGSVQVEAGDTFERTDAVRSNTSGEVLVRVGMPRRAELRVGLNSLVQTHLGSRWAPSREDASLGTKVQLIGEREGRHLLPTTAILVATSLPTGSPDARSSALTPEAKLAMGWSLADAWELSSNFNVSSIPEAGTRSAELVGSLSLGHDLTERMGSFAEWYGTRSHGALEAQYVNAGLTWALHSNAQLDARVGTGIGRAQGDYFFGLGLARRW